jgi:hypothetical protein
VERQTNGFVWTNISKFDGISTTPHLDLQERNRLGFELLKQEFAIIQSNVIIFLTGTKYDVWLAKLFTLNQEPVNMLYDYNGLLPRMSSQTKHPLTLVMQKKLLSSTR